MFRQVPSTPWAKMTREEALAYVDRLREEDEVDLGGLLGRLVADLDATDMEVMLNGYIPDEWLPPLLPYVWVFKTQEPFHEASIEDYIALFRRTGFVSDWAECPHPAEPLQVYRGATRPTTDSAHGMSWTTDLATAIRFAHRHDHLASEAVVALTIASAVSMNGPMDTEQESAVRESLSREPTVYSATIPPEGILARFYDQNEEEVLVDPAMLQGVRECIGDMPA